MTNFAKKNILLAGALAAVSAHAADDTNPADRQVVIREVPIAGLYNAPWFNYPADINEAEKKQRFKRTLIARRDDPDLAGPSDPPCLLFLWELEM